MPIYPSGISSCSGNTCNRNPNISHRTAWFVNAAGSGPKRISRGTKICNKGRASSSVCVGLREKADRICGTMLSCIAFHKPDRHRGVCMLDFILSVGDSPAGRPFRVSLFVYQLENHCPVRGSRTPAAVREPTVKALNRCPRRRKKRCERLREQHVKHVSNSI